PVVPYWWALALRLFGDQPVVWKVWLFPFCLLFVCSLYWLFRRFASGLEIPLVCLTVFSPTFLPSLNFMLDVPALALSLGALLVFFRACERRCVGLAMAAGLLAGLAMQTKYTSFIAPAVMLVYAAIFGRIRLGLAAMCVGLVLFSGWEMFLFLRQGES